MKQQDGESHSCKNMALTPNPAGLRLQSVPTRESESNAFLLATLILHRDLRLSVHNTSVLIFSVLKDWTISTETNQWGFRERSWQTFQLKSSACECTRLRRSRMCTSLPCVSDHLAQREEDNPTNTHTHTHTEGIKHLTLAARAVITLWEGAGENLKLAETWIRTLTLIKPNGLLFLRRDSLWIHSSHWTHQSFCKARCDGPDPNQLFNLD